MSYIAKAVANQFLYLAEEFNQLIDPMKIQKLVYYAHGWHLALTDEPLVDEIIEAWPYGPVIPSLYYEFKEYGAKRIERKALEWDVDQQDFFEPHIPKEDTLIAELITQQPPAKAGGLVR